MNENRRQILNMLAANKITAEEAERLLAALDSNGAANGSTSNTCICLSLQQRIRKHQQVRVDRQP